MKWNLIPGTKNYYATKSGLIKSEIKGRIKYLTQWADAKGYLRVKIVLNEKATSIAVHRLVALAFLPNPENKPQINHKNGIKTDNYLENLEWSTCAENVKHAWLTGLSKPTKGENHSTSKLNENKVYAIRIMYSLNKATLLELANIFKVNKSTIHAIIQNKNWKV